MSNFFRDQIEANKLVQYSLLAEWRRLGKAPDHTPADLGSTIRSKLDDVDKALMAELQESTAILASASCRIDIARAVGKYVSAHKNSFTPLKAIALDDIAGLDGRAARTVGIAAADQKRGGEEL